MISIIIFILLITVFDKNNLIEVWKLNQQLNELESQRDYYQQKITQDSTILENLKDDVFPGALCPRTLPDETSGRDNLYYQRVEVRLRNSHILMCLH